MYVTGAGSAVRVLQVPSLALSSALAPALVLIWELAKEGLWNAGVSLDLALLCRKQP